MKIIICTAGAFALVLAACGGYTPIGEGEPSGGTSGTGGTATMTGGTGGTATMTGGTGGTATMTGGTGGGPGAGGTSTMTGGTGGTSTMTGGTGGTGMYDPCANRVCGATCEFCDPNNSDCAAPPAIMYCDNGGNCTTTFPMCEANECETSMDCPVLDIACPTCPDGSTACPTVECVTGQCITSYPTCPEQMCMTDEQCPVSAAPCTMCSDGSTVCPWSDCVNGVCTSGIDSCTDVSPCDGKSCGDPCTPCAGSNCAGAAPIMAASYCDENLECVFNMPMCTTAECKVDMDCLAPDICMACPETGDCATMKCVNGGCQWQCTDPCGGCGHEQVCIYQIGGPGPSHYACATLGVCEDPVDYCKCVEGQGTCQPSMSSNYCQCENGLD
jgi:hypothetical protein